LYVFKRKPENCLEKPEILKPRFIQLGF
jgi:hypothetical protein